MQRIEAVFIQKRLAHFTGIFRGTSGEYDDVLQNSDFNTFNPTHRIVSYTSKYR